MNTEAPVPTTNGGTQKTPALTVDLQISKVVLDAASARLPLVQAVERNLYGKARSNLTTLAETILQNWFPGQTTRPNKTQLIKCKHCWREVSTYANGKLRRHGPPDDPCPEQWAPKQSARRSETRPLRFPMNRAEYDRIKENIHNHGQSVASVVTQRLAHFARHGEL